MQMEIIAIVVCSFTTVGVGTTVSVRAGKKVSENGLCPTCGLTESRPRYVLTFNAADPTGTIWVTAFNEHAPVCRWVCIVFLTALQSADSPRKSHRPSIGTTLRRRKDGRSVSNTKRSNI